MRIAIAKTEAAGGGVDHFTTDPHRQGSLMDRWITKDYGIKVVFSDNEFRTYPWSSIKFVDTFTTTP